MRQHGLRHCDGEDFAYDDMADELTSTLSTDWSGDNFRIQTLRGRFHPSGWSMADVATRWGVVMARCGAYRRRADGVEYVVDANTGFVRRPGEEWSAAAFTSAFEEVTIVELEARSVEQLPDLDSAAGPFTVQPSRALAHRMLVGALGSDDLDVELCVVELVGQCAAAARMCRRSGRREATAAARRRLVSDCVELLHVSSHEQFGLVELARRVGASPYHLSRVFREVVGMTISQYRTRLRVHDVLQRLGQGDDLATIAAATGFADHGHMTRTIRNVLGVPPSALRTWLGDTEVTARLHRWPR